MGQYTQHPRASYTASDADAMIEILRRVPSTGMLIDLNVEDTQRMIHWLRQATEADYLAQGSRWNLYRLHFQQHLDYRTGGTERPLNEWPEDMIKLFIVAWWTMVITDDKIETVTTFDQRALDLACNSYNAFAELLDVELI